MSPQYSRRRLLRVGAAGAGSVWVAGCNAPSRRPRFESQYRVSNLTDPVVSGGPTLQSGPTFFVTLLTSADEASRRLRADRLPDPYRESLTGLDYDESFLVAFVSRADVPETCLQSRVRDATFEFRLALESAPPMAESELVTVLEQWRLDGADPPSRAVMRLSFGEDGFENGPFVDDCVET